MENGKWKMKKKTEPYISGIGGVGHDRDPALERGHLEEGEVRVADVVEVHGRVLPSDVDAGQTRIGRRIALRFVVDDVRFDRFARLVVDALCSPNQTATTTTTTKRM